MNRHLYPLEEKKRVAFLAILCFVSYAATYIGRLNYSAALPEMVMEGILSKTDGGIISTAYFAAYGAGQMVNGFLADKCNPRIQVAAGIAGSAAMNLIMRFANSPSAMLAVWGINGYTQSLIWAPSFVMVSQSICWEFRAKALLLLNIAPSAGTILAYAFSGMMLRSRAWQDLFSGASAALLLTLTVWVCGCRILSRGAADQRKPTGFKARREFVTMPPSHPKRQGAVCLVTSGAVLLILPSMINGMLKDGVTSWLPTYLTDVFSMQAETAVLVSILLPLINISGAAIGYLLVRRLKNEVLCTSLLFLCAALCIVLLSAAGGIHPLVSAALFAVITAAMMASSVLLTSEIPSRFSGFGIAAAVSGFLNACGYAGTAISTYGIAWVAEDYGWAVTRSMWTAAALAAMSLSLMAVPFWKKYLKAYRRR